MGLIGSVVGAFLKAALNDQSATGQLNRELHPEAYEHAERLQRQLQQRQLRERMYRDRERISGNSSNQNQEGCFITTAVCDNFGKPDDCYELTAFRKFRDGWLKLQSDGQKLIDEYYKTAPTIVAKINSLPNAKIIYSEIWDNYLSKCLSYIEARDYTACKKLYIKMVEDLKSKFTA